MIQKYIAYRAIKNKFLNPLGLSAAKSAVLLLWMTQEGVEVGARKPIFSFQINPFGWSLYADPAIITFTSSPHERPGRDRACAPKCHC